MQDSGSSETSINVEFETPVVAVGKLMKGQIVVNVNNEEEICSSIGCNIIGIQICKVNYLMEVGANGAGTSVSVPTREDTKFLDLKFCFSTGTSGKLVRGRYAYPFQFQIPENFPPSMDANYQMHHNSTCSVSYWAQVWLDQPAFTEGGARNVPLPSADIRNMRHFCVTTAPPPAVPPNPVLIIDPQVLSLHYMGCICRGRVAVEAVMSSSTLHAGTTYPLKFKVSKDSMIKLKSMEISLIEKVTCSINNKTASGKYVLFNHRVNLLHEQVPVLQRSHHSGTGTGTGGGGSKPQYAAFASGEETGVALGLRGAELASPGGSSTSTGTGTAEPGAGSGAIGGSGGGGGGGGGDEQAFAALTASSGWHAVEVTVAHSACSTSSPFVAQHFAGFVRTHSTAGTAGAAVAGGGDKGHTEAIYVNHYLQFKLHTTVGSENPVVEYPVKVHMHPDRTVTAPAEIETIALQQQKIQARRALLSPEQWLLVGASNCWKLPLPGPLARVAVKSKVGFTLASVGAAVATVDANSRNNSRSVGHSGAGGGGGVNPVLENTSLISAAAGTSAGAGAGTGPVAYDYVRP
jgi:hypothetical protein